MPEASDPHPDHAPVEGSDDDPEAYRRRLYEVLGDESLSSTDRLEEAIEVGRSFLGVENGHVSKLLGDGDRQVVTLSSSVVAGERPLVEVGERMDMARTYCRLVEDETPFAVSNAPEQGFEDDPAYRTHGVACYFGVGLIVEGERWGTLCFVNEAPRETTLSETERSFVELVARCLERELASGRYERELASHRERLDDRERRLERSERKYESLVEMAPEAILLVDAETARLREVNAAATELTGYDREDLLGGSAYRLLDSDHRDRYRDAAEWFVSGIGRATHLDDGTPINIVRADGERVPVEVSASTVEMDGERFVQAILRDVSDRRERERELRLKDRAIEEANVGITITEAGESSNPLTYVNPEFSRLTGYDRESVLGRDCRMLQGAGTDEEAVADIRSAIEQEEPVQRELLNYRADGTPFWNEVTVTPITAPDGEVTHFVGFQQDVTDRKRRERLLDVLNRVLRHNLRNDMTVVRGHANLLENHDLETVADSATTIAETAGELVELSEKARTLEEVASSVETLDSVDVQRLTERALARIRHDRGPISGELSLSVEADSVPSALGTARLEQVVGELVRNALKHAGERPTVEVEVGTEPATASDRLEHDRSAGDWVVIRVRDDGPGLTEMERAAVDGREATPLDHGTGLGLWLVNWLVTGVGGEVAVEDGGPSGETVVTVRLRQAETADGASVRYVRSALGDE